MVSRASLKDFIPKSLRNGIRTARSKISGAMGWMQTRIHRPNLFAANTPERLGIIYEAKTHLSIPERLFLYSVVRGTEPQRILEIGSALGGSAAIMAAALQDNGAGRIIGIDPYSPMDPAHKRYFGRFHLIRCAAPQGIDEATRMAGGTFDMVFYDGPNVYDVTSDVIAAITPHLSERAYIVFDNGYHYGVHQALTDAMQADARLHDCGFTCVRLGVHDKYVAYNGLRLVRFETANVSDPQPRIDTEYRRIGKTAPSFDTQTINHDVWWCSKVRPCPKCAGVNNESR